MIGNLLKKIIGDKNTKDRSTYQPFVESVNAVYPEIQSLTDNELRSQTNTFIQKIQEDKSALEEQLAEAQGGSRKHSDFQFKIKQQFLKELKNSKKRSMKE